MTNNDIISTVTSKYMNVLSDEVDEFIQKNYKEVASGYPHGNWFKVCRRGNDYKYGSYMIEPNLMLWRGQTFNEFYGGGVVD